MKRYESCFRLLQLDIHKMFMNGFRDDVVVLVFGCFSRGWTVFDSLILRLKPWRWRQ